MDDKLVEAIHAARRAYDAMTPEQKKAHDDAQRESFVRGMVGPELTRTVAGYGCICPPTSEQTCKSPFCPRQPLAVT